MKRLMILAAMVLMIASACYGDATRWNINGIPNSDWFSNQNNYRNVPLMWMRTVDPLIAAMRGTATKGTSNYYWVDSNVANEGDGTDVLNAKNTLEEGINCCTANNGDVVIVVEGHAESGTAAGLWDADIAGITIYHCGNGSNQGTYTFADTDTTVVLGAANVTIVGGRLLAGISEVVCGLSVEAAADDCAVIGMQFPEPATSTYEFDKAIVMAAGADRLTIAGCTGYSCDATGATCWLDMSTGVNNGTNILNNHVEGYYSSGIVYSNKADLENLIVGNAFRQMTNNVSAIVFPGTATGMSVNIVEDCNEVGNSLNMAMSRAELLSKSLAACPYFTPSSGSQIYFVDEYSANSGTTSAYGRSWYKPYSTIAAAITANNAGIDWGPSQGEWWGQNNFIVVAPGTYSEELASCPHGCTVIGLGSGGGFAGGRPSTEGSARIVTTTTDGIAGSCIGTTWVGMHFETSMTSGKVCDLTTVNNTKFINCTFWTNVADLTAYIEVDNATRLVIKNCIFSGGTTPGGYGIYIGANSGTTFFDCIIEDNIINAATAGIFVNSTVTLSGNSWIKGNSIANPTKGIDLNNTSNNLVKVSDNRIIASSDAIEGATAALVIANWVNENGTADWEADEAD